MSKDIKKKKPSTISRVKRKVVSKIAALKSKRVPAARGSRKVTEIVSKQASVKKGEEISALSIPVHAMEVEQSKYYTGPQNTSPVRSVLTELEFRDMPTSYNEDIVVLQIRDPWWIHTYWDVRKETFDRLSREHGSFYQSGRWVLRAYDVSYIQFDGTNAHRFFDTGIDVGTRNWYLNLASPGTSWCVDLGIVLSDGRFIVVARSNTIAMPLDSPSWMTDEEWMIPEEEFRRLYGMSVGLGPNVTSSVGRLWQERLKKDLFSGAMASMGVSSPTKPGESKGKKGQFWLVVDCELIVYGATEPDAKVTVQGRPITLRKDGTFSLRFALPDGKQDIPVEAVSAHIDERRVITPIVTRKTTRNP